MINRNAYDKTARIKLNAKARSDKSVGLVLAHRDAILANYTAGKLSHAEIGKLGLAEFCRQAGVSENFLNGPGHKTNLKPQIKTFLASLKEMSASLDKAEAIKGTKENILEEVSLSLQRYKDMLHGARLQLHAKRQAIQSLSTQNPPTVVRLKRDDPT